MVLHSDMSEWKNRPESETVNNETLDKMNKTETSKIVRKTPWIPLKSKYNQPI